MPGKRLALAGGVGAHDDDLVEQRSHLPHVEDHDVAPLDVFQRGHRGLGELVESHLSPGNTVHEYSLCD
ncbi:hypothetical protein D3C83_80910 [compost metagenome]